ncbi:MAG: HTH domain-containing protein, partial [Weeksellaceae bacterium]|nr:HTH domain-containing protein [Weeksellaceae bacterium]
MEKTIQLLLLLSGSRSYSIQELEDRFEISERTVYRYLNHLENAGLVLDRQGGRYRFVQNSTENKSLQRLFHFTEEEAEIFYHSLENLNLESETVIRLMRKLHALYDFKALKRIKDPSSVEKIKKLTEGIVNKKRIKLCNYRSSNSSTVSDRKVEPFQFMEDYKAVWCLDLSDQKNKQFRISRIGDVEVLDSSWR